MSWKYIGQNALILKAGSTPVWCLFVIPLIGHALSADGQMLGIADELRQQAAPARFRLLAVRSGQRYIASCFATKVQILRHQQTLDIHHGPAVLLTCTHIVVYTSSNLRPLLRVPREGKERILLGLVWLCIINTSLCIFCHPCCLSGILTTW